MCLSSLLSLHFFLYFSLLLLCHEHWGQNIWIWRKMKWNRKEGGVEWEETWVHNNLTLERNDKIIVFRGKNTEEKNKNERRVQKQSKERDSIALVRQLFPLFSDSFQRLSAQQSKRCLTREMPLNLFLLQSLDTKVNTVSNRGRNVFSHFPYTITWMTFCFKRSTLDVIWFARKRSTFYALICSPCVAVIMWCLEAKLVLCLRSLCLCQTNIKCVDT